jgi:hypothetical protein
MERQLREFRIAKTTKGKGVCLILDRLLNILTIVFRDWLKNKILLG